VLLLYHLFRSIVIDTMEAMHCTLLLVAEYVDFPTFCKLCKVDKTTAHVLGKFVRRLKTLRTRFPYYRGWKLYNPLLLQAKLTAYNNFLNKITLALMIEDNYIVDKSGNESIKAKISHMGRVWGRYGFAYNISKRCILLDEVGDFHSHLYTYKTSKHIIAGDFHVSFWIFCSPSNGFLSADIVKIINHHEQDTQKLFCVEILDGGFVTWQTKGNVSIRMVSGTVIKPGQWQHILLTTQHDDTILYVDGEAVRDIAVCSYSVDDAEHDYYTSHPPVLQTISLCNYGTTEILIEEFVIISSGVDLVHGRNNNNNSNNTDVLMAQEHKEFIKLGLPFAISKKELQDVLLT